MAFVERAGCRDCVRPVAGADACDGGAGQVQATIDDREAQTGVQRSQAEVAQAQAALRNAQANYDRTRDLQGKGFANAAALVPSGRRAL